MSDVEPSLIDRIKSKRAYADVPISDTEAEANTSNESNGKEIEARPTKHHGAASGLSAVKTTDGLAADVNEHLEISDERNDASNIPYAVGGMLGVFEEIKMNNIPRDLKETTTESDDGRFHTMFADRISESDEETDHITDVDFDNLKALVFDDKPTSAHGKPEIFKDPTMQIPCDIFYLNEKSVLQRFETFDQLSEWLVSAALKENPANSEEFKSQFRKLLKLPIRTLEHFSTVGVFLRNLYEKDHLIDVVIDVKGTLFGAHRIALCCHSDYFSDMFKSNKAHKIPFEIKIKGISTDAFACFLEYCYTGELIVAKEIASDMLLMADFLKVRALKRNCGEIAESLPLDQTVKMVVKCDPNSKGKIYEVLYKRMVENFSGMSDFNLFLSMDVELLCRFLECDNLVVGSEYELFTIVIRWILHDSDNRVKHTVRIMNLIRFDQMTSHELCTCVETTSLLRGYDKFRELVLIANWLLTTKNLAREDPFHFHVSKPRLYKVPNTHQTQLKPFEQTIKTKLDGDVTIRMPPPVMTSTPRSSVTSTEESAGPGPLDIFVVGGFIADEANDENPRYVERFAPNDNHWVHFCRMQEPRRHHAVVTIDNYIYLIGGSDPRIPGKVPTPTKTVYRMDPSIKVWSTVSFMNVARYSHCACAVRGRIYVFGGKGNNDSVRESVECYDPVTDGWFYVTSMDTPRFAAAAASIGKIIYVVGGLSESVGVPASLHVLKTVVCYNTETNSWLNVVDLRFPRCHSNLVNVGGHLFLCGGATRSYDVKNSVLSSVASLDRYDSTTKEWVNVADMVVPRHDMGVAVAGSRIFMIGGISTTADRVLKSVECYDTVTCSWVPGVEDLPHPARWVCCVTLTTASMKKRNTFKRSAKKIQLLNRLK
ncbi:kelch-like protein 12 [Mya arenaria]|uniref:kelch-like protein 12 n=1 Tax=Mya arenaria TaxID=6604 RepID=UPI0022E75DE6|nr:kelch-like protein 12 [Mya arenaria]